MRWNGFLATTIAGLLFAAAPAVANTYSVTGTDDIAGSCAGTACSSLRAALTAAAGNPGQDRVEVPAGLYQLAGTPLQLSDVTLVGAGARTTTIAGTSTSRAIEVHNTTATIGYLTLTGGTATDAAGYFGGNLAAYTSTVLLDHVRITGGSGSSGGGLANRNGSMTIQNSLIDHNQALEGGGDGGGIINFGGDGGGAASMVVKDTTIAFNSARLAGGVISRGSTDNTLAFEGVTLAWNAATNIAIGGVQVPTADGGAFSTRGSVFARNQGPLGASNCDTPTLVSNGGNVDDGQDCALTGAADSSDTSANLDVALRNYGGETDVLPFLDPSPALNRGGTCSTLDQTGITRGGACDAGAWEYRINRKVTISDGPSGSTSSQTATFDFGSDAGAPYECRLFTPAEQSPPYQACDPGVSYADLRDGTYRFEVVPGVTREPGQGDTRVFTVDDGSAPVVTITGAPAAVSDSASPAFTFESDDPGATFTCSLDGAPPAPCASGVVYESVPAGAHTFRVTATDVLGRASSAEHAFTVTAPQPAQTPVPTAAPTPAATPTPTPAPDPPPVANKSVAAEKLRGTVLVKPKGSRTFVALADLVIGNGAQVDTRHGAVVITTAAGEKATFSDGLFTVSQSGGITTLALSEALDCRKAKRGKARAAAKKPKSRKLWGDGKGKFRTKGSYSAATVRGTKWLVQDTCTTTLTRVTQGVVRVRDDVKKKTLTLRKGKSYTARAKR